jgi:hypothetical protein
MAYRGEDLDLRTPERWGARDHARMAGERTAGEPYYVDDTVLACCNHAFDLALAHRALEVRLEHLLNAMTRTDAAAAIMERRGIAVAMLRRESANAIAADGAFATSGAGMRSNPRRSQELEDVLRLAAERAYPRRAAIAVDDLLAVLFEMNRDHSGLAMLRRHAGAWSSRDLNDTLPPLAAPFEAVRDRVRVPAQSYFAAELPRQSIAPPAASGFGGTMTDSVQNNRIDQLERMIRDLSADQVNERKTFASLISELQRETVTQRDDTGRFRGNLNDRLQSLEQTVVSTRSETAAHGPQIFDRLGTVERNVEAKFNDLGRAWSTLGDRLQSIEHMVGAAREPMPLPVGLLDRLQSVDGVERKLEDVGRAFSAVLDRLNLMERSFANRPATPAVNMQPLVDRLATLERAVVNRPMPTVDMSQIHDRLAAMERAMSTRSTSVDLAPVHERLASMERAINVRSASVDLAPLHERLASMERMIATRPVAQAVDLAPVHERLAAMDRTMSSRTPQAAVDMGPLHERIAGIERMIANRPVPTLDIAPLAERMTALERVIASRPAPTLDLTPVNDRIAGIERAIARYPVPTPVDLTPVFDRLTGIEARANDAGRLSAALNERFGQFERTMQSTLQTSLQATGGNSERAVNTLGERLKGIEDSMLSHQVEVAQLTGSISTELQGLARDVRGNSGMGDRIQSFVGEHLQSFSSDFDKQGADIVTAIASPLSERMAALSTEVQGQNAENAKTIAQITEKLAGIEKTLAVFGQRTIDTHTAHGRDLIEVHDALVKLNSNQQTLAASMDQWRLDTNTDLGFITTRMEGIEKVTAKPVQMLESLSYNMQTLQRTTVKREEQRSRFRQWLMGTDDWYGASWEQNGSRANGSVPHTESSIETATAVEDGRPMR